ncbi:unnamed protein product [Effrenium voratum]|nr:unnamed protein product [Effrenium voratum]
MAVRRPLLQVLLLGVACSFCTRLAWCLPSGFRAKSPASLRAPRITAKAAEQESEARWQSFAAWLAARGGNMANVKIAEINGMRGLVATRDIAENESIVEIPLGASIDITDEKKERDPSLNALNLLRLQNEEELAPYFELLPGRDSEEMVRMPDFYSDEELEMLQCPEVIQKTKRRRRGQ